MKHKTLRTLLCVILTVCFCLSAIAPVSAAGLFGGDSGAASLWDEWFRGLKERFTEKQPGTEEVIPVTQTGTEGFLRIFHLDCGRIYFSVDQIKDIIDTLAANNYTHLELAFGNGGLRFLLDDMGLNVGGTAYTSNDVKAAILEGNTTFAQNDGHNNDGEGYGDYLTPNTCLTQSDMDTILTYASGKGIGIIPLLNTPGHMNAVVSAIGTLTDKAAGYPVSEMPANSTINIDDANVQAFAKALIQKYVTYFSKKGCTYFNLGADEFANDPSDAKKLGFNTDMKDGFISYVNSIATIIKDANMTPMMFNDGYAWSDATFNSDIIVCYWTTGAVSSEAIAQKGHKVINTNRDWYYVLGSPFGTGANNWCSYAQATNGVNGVPVTTMNDGKTVSSDKLAGAMICLWCDFTNREYTDAEVTNVRTLLETLASNNRTQFGDPREQRTITLTVGQTKEETLATTESLNTTSLNPDIATVTAVQEQIPSYTANKVMASNSLTVGEQYRYLIVNKRATTLKLLTATPAEGEHTNKLKLIEYLADSDELWTLGYARGSNNNSGYTLSRNIDGSQKYLTIGSGSASVSATNNVPSMALSLAYDDTSDYWTITKNSQYLNDYKGNEGLAAGYGTNDAGSRWDIYKVVEGASTTDTKLTFTGVAVGTTSVSIGNYDYTIHVVEESLANAPNLTYYPFISNYAVFETAPSSYPNEGVGNPQTISASANSSIYSEAGVDLANIAWPEGVWAYGNDAAPTKYWKGMLHTTSGDHQVGANIDKSMVGTEFRYVRYWGSTWAVSANGTEWTPVDTTNDELCAYYLQKTDITQEVTTYVKDWGYRTNDYSNYSMKDHKALSFAVVYPSGQMNPAEADIYNDSTLIYWHDTGATHADDTMLIRVGVSDIYEVEKITWTLGTLTDNATPGELNWNKVPIEGGEWYNETVCWPNPNNPNQTELAIRTGDFCGYNQNTYNTAGSALLILIYLKPVVTEGALHVRYVDDDANAEIFNYDINITNTAGEPAGTFLNRLTTNTALPSAPGGFFELADTAYVVNAANVHETFEKNLTGIPSLHGSRYASGLYQYTGAEISTEDNTLLILHYDLDESKLSKSYVVDFGSPITIPALDFMERPEDIESVSVRADTLRYGTVTPAANGQTLTYTLLRPLDATEDIHVEVTFKESTSSTNGGRTQNFIIGIIPATNVYYEETFLTRERTTGDWVHTATAGTVVKNQEKEIIGSHTYVYGYDKNLAENNGVAPSGGSEYRATLTLPNDKKTIYTNDKLTFSFTGTGFDLISSSGSNTGMLVVRLDAANAGTTKTKTYIIDTYFHGDPTILTNGTTIHQTPILRELDLAYDTYTVAIRGALYRSSGAVVQPEPPSTTTQIREFAYADAEAFDLRAFLDECGFADVSVDDVELIYMDENSILNGGTGMTGAVQTSERSSALGINTVQTKAASDITATVSVDGFRVYNPLSNPGTLYEADGEDGAVYKDLRQYVQEGNSSDALTNQVLYVEYNTTLGVADIANYNTSPTGTNGPKHEIYLAPGCGIAFAVPDTFNKDEDILQLSAKIVSGTPQLTVGNTVFNTTTDPLKLNGTEMYFDISECVQTANGKNYFTIQNTSPQSQDSKPVLAVNVLKMRSGTAPAAINAETQNIILAAFAANMASEPVETFQPEVFEVYAPATARRNRTFSISANVSVSNLEKVTITTADGVETELNALNKLSVKWGISSEFYYLKSFRMKQPGDYTYKITAYGTDGSCVSKNVTVTVQ